MARHGELPYIKNSGNIVATITTEYPVKTLYGLELYPAEVE
jgi:hypothetical protein